MQGSFEDWAAVYAEEVGIVGPRRQAAREAVERELARNYPNSAVFGSLLPVEVAVATE